MNKLYLFLAFAVFALVACSEDKPQPTQSEICAKKPVTKECLIGKWYLSNVEGHYECTPAGGDNLVLDKKGGFTFNFSRNNVNNWEKTGTWELLDGGEMKITFFDGGDYDPSGTNPINAKIDVSAGPKLEITTTNYSGFLQCGAPVKFTEIYVWGGK